MSTLVPSQFFDESCAGSFLAQVVESGPDEIVNSKYIPAYDAYLVYNGDKVPELFYILEGLDKCREYNKIICSHKDGILSMAIAQGKTLLLSNEYEAADFVTAEYFIFLAMKQLQLNPEVSTICWRHVLEPAQEMSLCSYFKAVEVCE